MNEINNLKEFIKKFEPEELLNFVVILSSLPENRLHIVRFETLFKLIASIPEHEFNKSKLTENHSITMLEKLAEFTDWSPVEDYVPISILDYPPLWILGKRFRVFSGVQDRTYEYWKDLIAYYFPLRDVFVDKLGYDPIQLILDLLEFHNKLFSLIERKHVSNKTVNGIYLPHPELIESWKKISLEWYKKTTWQSLLASKSIQLGNLSFKEVIETEPIESLYKICGINFTKSQLMIFPHCIQGFVSYMLNEDLQKLGDISNEVIYNTQSRIYRELKYMFGTSSVIPDFTVTGCEEVDFAVNFDANKLFLIDIIHTELISFDNIQHEIEKSINKIKFIDEKIKNGEKQIIHKEKQIGKIPNIEIEVIPILLLETNSSYYSFIMRRIPYLKTRIHWIGTVMDFLSLISDISDGMRFLKFLRREKELLERLDMLTMNTLDHYAHYVINNDSFLQNGKLPSLISFAPGIWDKYIIEKIKKRPDFQPRFQNNEYDDFWKIEVINEKTFSVYNPLFGYVANIVRFDDNRTIWILGLDGKKDQSPDELASIRLLAELIPYRFAQNSAFQTFLQEIGIRKENQIEFTILPSSLIQRRNMNHFNEFVEKISDQNPILTKGIQSPEGRIIFPMIYSIDSLSKLFKSDKLTAEKKIIKKILDEIASYFSSDMTKNIILVQKCMDDIFKNARSAFNFQTFHHYLLIGNDDRPQYPKILESDRSEIQRMIAEFLTNESVTPGKYHDQRAKEIINKTYEFLKMKITEQLANYDHTKLIPFILDIQGELIKERMLTRTQAQNDLKEIKEYDAVERYTKANQEISILDVTLRYLTELIIQQAPTGNKILTLENWSYIQALAEAISYATLISDHLHYGLAKYQVNLSNSYLFSIESLTSSIPDYLTNFDRMFVKGEKIVESPKSDLQDFYNSINSPFEDEFKVSFEDFFNVIIQCLVFLNERHVSTITISEDELVSFIKSKLNRLDKNKIISALYIVTFTGNSLNGIEVFPADTRKRKDRLIVKPLVVFSRDGKKIYTINSWLTDNSIGRWFAEIRNGYLPYNDNFIKKDGYLIGALIKQREQSNKDHENEIKNLIQPIVQFSDFNIKDNQKCFTGLGEPSPGEIDGLALFTKQREILLIEAKDLKMNYSPRDISNQMKDFIDPDKGYIVKLLKKKTYVTKYLSKILEYYGIKDDASLWVVKTMFVTSNVTFPISSFDEFSFITLVDLKDFLINHTASLR